MLTNAQASACAKAMAALNVAGGLLDARFGNHTHAYELANGMVMVTDGHDIERFAGQRAFLLAYGVAHEVPETPVVKK